MPFGFHLTMDTLPSGDLLLRPTTLLNAVSWIWRPSFERQRDFNPPEQRAAQRTLRTSPPPHTARSISHELPVDPDGDHRWGFPCCVWSPLPTCRRHYPGRSDGAYSLVCLHRHRPSLCNSQVGSCNYCFGTCLAFTHVTACTLAESPRDPLHRRLRQFRCLHCRLDCYRVERTSSRAGVAPAEVQRLSRRTITPIETPLARQ